MPSRATNRRADDGTTVLLATADPVLLRDCSALFAVRYTCLTAVSVEQAKQVLQKEPVKVMLLAEQLPGGKGLDFVRASHRLKPQIKTVLLAEQADMKPIITAFNEGCIFRCLLLPADPETLARAVKDALRRYEMDRIQQELSAHAEKIDLYVHSMPYWLHRLKLIVSEGARPLVMGTGLILGAGLLILVLGVSILLLLYYLKSMLGIDFFEHRHLRDFLPA